MSTNARGIKMLNKLKNIILVKLSQITMFKEFENTLHYFKYYMWH